MIQVFVKTLWGELLSIECHEYDSLEDIGKILHCENTEEFPRIPLITREKDGLLEDGEILCLVPYPEVDVEISLLHNSVFGDFGTRNEEPPVMAKYQLYEAKIQTGHGFFYIPFLVFRFERLSGHSIPRRVYELFLPSYRPLNPAGVELVETMSHYSSAFCLKEGDWEDGPILVDEELVRSDDPWFQIDSTHFKDMHTIGATLARVCMEGVVEERDYVESYLREVLLEKWEEVE